MQLHNDNGEWVYKSYNPETGRIVICLMEQFIKDYDARFGTKFFSENMPLKYIGD